MEIQNQEQEQEEEETSNKGMQEPQNTSSQEHQQQAIFDKRVERYQQWRHKHRGTVVTGKIVGHSEQDVNKIVKLVDAARENPELQYLVDQVDSRDKKLNVTIKEYLHFKTPNPRSGNVLHILSAWSCPLFSRRAREILLYTLL